MPLYEKYLDEGMAEDLLKQQEVRMLVNNLKSAESLLFSYDLSTVKPDTFRALKLALKRIKKEIEHFNQLVIKAHLQKK